MTMHWGILGPGSVESVRRVRTLGLAASVRTFNDLAVPGLGGVWFGKQVFLATLGVLVAERAANKGAKVTKIAVANAIEALACWQSLSVASRDGRVRGSDKLAGRSGADFRFDNASRPSFYVTQPMRMASVATLPALGLVDASGSRFNAFTCTPAGLDFVEAACAPYRPYNTSVIDFLVKWVLGEVENVDSERMRAALSPLTELPIVARDLLRERLHRPETNALNIHERRRSDALHWVQSRRRGALPANWDEQPSQISDAAHWKDMLSGARFFATQAAAYSLLDNLEMEMPTSKVRFTVTSVLSPRVSESLALLRTKAQIFLKLEHKDDEANAFCREMVAGSNEDVLRNLVARDGRILRLVGDHIVAGPAFKGGEILETGTDVDGQEAPTIADPDWPEDISYRIRNLWWLGLDLDGDMNQWLNPSDEEATHV